MDGRHFFLEGSARIDRMDTANLIGMSRALTKNMPENICPAPRAPTY